MSLTQALGTAAAGLRAAQTGLSIVAANVANAQTPGYTSKHVETSAITAGGDLISVRVSSVDRTLDQFVQRQLRSESSGGAYASLRTQFYQRLQGLYGDPNSSTALESLYNDFSTSLQALTVSPSDYSARTNVLSTAQALAQQLNSTSSSIQDMRLNAEQGLADCVTSANECLTGLAQINTKLSASTGHDTARASLLDQRDYYLDQLATLMDVRVMDGDNDMVSVYTNSGIQLVGSQAAQLTFDERGMMSAQAEWSGDPSQRQVGTISLLNRNGSTMDLVAGGAFRSGQIAAYLEMRDEVLPEAQRQLDEFAAAMSRALSDVTTDGTAVTSGAQAGFDVDVAGLQAGNSVKVSWIDNGTGATHTATLVRVDDPNALPLSNTLTPDPNDQVIGIDFSSGLANAITQMNAALGPAVEFSNPSGTTLRILDDGAAATSDISAASVTTTTTAVAGGTTTLPFFMDGTRVYSGAPGENTSQTTGYAGRITVNAALLEDPSKLVVYDTGVPQGDKTRANFLLDRLTTDTQAFSPATGIGSTDTPFSGSLPSYLRQVMSQQGAAAADAKRLSDGQSMVVDALQQRLNEGSAVNVDKEMTTLLTLQTAYGANARVFTVVNEMLQTLMKM
ncbi:Flagellar hook-associated protein FlgK [Rhodovulum sp. PH10]|uniref:flagellar hook-associated protein FlgK n=1 Tax=Rhodovulum sp. PH10 TaxID=1187851 RepID=UPI00027C20C8|nr:flagellar hook-associated protein FlgK [Rhodovulum sp. PH10]EJW09648.1 Flagellar hook-associated protein FlgK [Rhodovulum sp. PH10]